MAVSLCPDLEENEKIDLESAVGILEKIFIVGASGVGALLIFAIIWFVIKKYKEKKNINNKKDDKKSIEPNEIFETSHSPDSNSSLSL